MLRLLIALAAVALTFGGGLPSSSAPQTPAAHAAPAQCRPGTPPRKRALLVGISDYCPPGRRARCGRQGDYWWDLNSRQDVEALEAVLLSDKFGFLREDVVVLKTKEETTSRKIREVFQTFLIDQTCEGDIVYFHYSGHGGQLPDDNTYVENRNVGDELDGLDECLIPSDYLTPNYRTRRDGWNYIRDDEVGHWLTLLKAKKPSNITITMDSCYSGSNTRAGEHLVRGAQWEDLSRIPTVDRVRAVEDDPSGFFKRGEVTAGATDAQDYVVISATRDNQLAEETINSKGQKMGLLSCALAEAFSAASPRTTYADIFEQINSYITRTAHSQNPQIEGARYKVLMRETLAPPQPYVLVDLRGAEPLLKAGWLQGITAGSRFDIHPKGADPKDTAPLAQAEVLTVNLDTSVLKLLGPTLPHEEELRLARAVETEHNYGDMRLRVAFDDSASAAAPLRRLKELSLVNAELSPGETPHVRICRGRCENEAASAASPNSTFAGYTVMRWDGSVLRRVADGARQEQGLRDVLEAEARWHFVKGLQNNDPGSIVGIKFRLVPVRAVYPPNRPPCNRREDKENPACLPLGTEDLPRPPVAERVGAVLRRGELYQLEFLNTGSVPAFVTVLDLRSDGTMMPLWPAPADDDDAEQVGNSEENRIDSDGKWHRVPWRFTIGINEPFGPETFKVIATRDPMDFSPLLDPPRLRRGVRGNQRGAREAATPLGRFLMTAAFPGLTRRDGPSGLGAASVKIPMGDWGTAEITFEAAK
jgi:hypothetical protein